MIFTDIIALIIVYVYVAVIFVVAEMVLKTRPEVSRKFLHIMVGNMIFAIISPANDPKFFIWIVALAIVPMVYGDGFAALIGQKFGKVKYTIFGGTKSLEGSLTMFVITTVMSVFVWMVFTSIGCTMPEFNIVNIIMISAVATLCEAFSYGGIDNLTVPAVTSILYYLVAVL